MSFNINPFQRIWQAIIRPPRQLYTQADLGFQFNQDPINFISMVNILYELIIKQRTRESKKFASVISNKIIPLTVQLSFSFMGILPPGLQCNYRSHSFNYLKLLLPHQFDLVSFDFCGSGISDGEYVTLGYRQKDDLHAVIEFLNQMGVKQIALWGRSMGAVTALQYILNRKKIKCLILDSPFSDFQSLLQQIGDQKIYIPNFIIQIIISFLRNTIIQKVSIQLIDQFRYQTTPQTIKEYSQSLNTNINCSCQIRQTHKYVPFNKTLLKNEVQKKNHYL